jgi:hypothetical protein
VFEVTMVGCEFTDAVVRNFVQSGQIQITPTRTKAMPATKRLAKFAALVAIALLASNSLLQLDGDDSYYLLRTEGNGLDNNPMSTSDGYDVHKESSLLQHSTEELTKEQAPPEETSEQFTLRILDRTDKERRMDDSQLQDIHKHDQQMSSGGGINEPFYICNRPADLGIKAQHATCPGSTNSNQLLLLDGTDTYGRTGNNLIEFLHALQYSRDNDIQLGIRYGSWAMRVLLRMWLEVKDDQSQWEADFEKAFCIKLIHSKQELKQWDNVIQMDTKALLLYKSNQSFEEYASFQQHALRTLFQNYNTGKGTTLGGVSTRSMCEGIDALFGKDSSSAIYSVIHLRQLEKVGYQILGAVAKRTGCDPRAAIEMRPDYIRAILKPLGMLQHPIVIITDDRNQEAIQRLLDDPEIGPKIALIPREASWRGGDMTLGIMSNVFIGNPASSFSGFIAKSRMALGKGHNYLFRARGSEGRWQTVCGDSCVFDKYINHF